VPPDRLPLDFERLPFEEMRERARVFRDEARRRRSVRDCSPEPVPRDLIDACIAAAGSAPSGAQP
jgi:hypothetical protein